MYDYISDGASSCYYTPDNQHTVLSDNNNNTIVTDNDDYLNVTMVTKDISTYITFVCSNSLVHYLYLTPDTSSSFKPTSILLLYSHLDIPPLHPPLYSYLPTSILLIYTHLYSPLHPPLYSSFTPTSILLLYIHLYTPPLHPPL